MYRSWVFGIFGFCSIIGAIVAQVNRDTASTVVTFPTPLEELDRIRESCEKKEMTGFQEARDKYQKCLLSMQFVFEGGDGRIVGRFGCNTLSLRRFCWDDLIIKINDCIPRRGTTVGKIYNSFAEIACQDEKQFQILHNQEKVCPVQAIPTTECSNDELITSADLCESFKAQRLCEESDLRPCDHQEHKILALKHLEQMGNNLNCVEGHQGNTTAKIMETSKGQSSDDSANGMSRNYLKHTHLFILIATNFIVLVTKSML